LASIEDEEVPLAVIDEDENYVNIEDDDTPLADNPLTGETAAVLIESGAAGAAGLTGLLASRKNRKKNKDKSK
jgi:hypothetical protein